MHGWFIFAEDIDAEARLITEDDDMMRQNMEVPWWDPNYVRTDKKVNLVRCHCVFLISVMCVLD